MLAVLGYHADLGILPGGFLGVEVFFVISGFLITALLLAEWDAAGRIDVRAFWIRRARRLLPALFLLLAVVLAFFLVVVPDEVARLRGEVLAAAGYVTNWYLVLGHQSYFEASGRPSPLQHLWSLAVEEQFYVLWPLLLSVGLIVLRRRGMLVATLGAAAASAVLMAAIVQPDADPSRVYYGTDTRASGLLLGATLAFAWIRRPEAVGTKDESSRWSLPPLLIDACGLLGLASIGAMFLATDEFDPFLYRGGLAALDLLTVLVIWAAVHPRGRLGARILDWRPLRWIGQRSYSIYLWHWPVFTLTRPGFDAPLDAMADFALRLGVTVALAELSYRFVEMPIREGGLTRAWRWWQARQGTRRRWAYTLAAAAAATSIVLALAVGVEVVGASGTSSVAYLPAASIQTDLPGPTSVPASDPSASVSPENVASDSPDWLAAPSGPPPATLAATPPASPSAIPSVSASATATGAARPSPRLHLPVYAVGDSVMLGAAVELSRAIGPLEIDAVVGRSFEDGISVLAARMQAQPAPRLVIVGLGNNGPITPSELDRLLNAVRSVPRVVVVNLRVPRDYEAHNDSVLANGVRRYSNVVLVDWHAASAGRQGLFWDDGMHVRPEGAKLYAGLVASAAS